MIMVEEGRCLWPFSLGVGGGLHKVMVGRVGGGLGALVLPGGELDSIVDANQPVFPC